MLRTLEVRVSQWTRSWARTMYRRFTSLVASSFTWVASGSSFLAP